MSSLGRFAALVALVGVSLVIVPAVASTPPQPFKVTSTLDHVTVLPHRIHWVASIGLPASQLTNWAFQIDGKTRWVGGGRNPVVYADGNGYLVTSWLSPGKHTFTIRVYATNHRMATDTATARVLPTPPPPKALAGSWSRTVDPTGGPQLTPGHLAPAGMYKLTFEKRWIQDHLPGRFNRGSSGSTGQGMIIDNDWTPAAQTFHAQGDVVSFPPDSHVNQETGNSWCFPGGPGADYTWKVTGDQLTLSPRGGKDACAIRGFIWTGTWTKVG